MHQLDLWIRKIERANKYKYISPKYFSQITKYVEEAFMYDFNLIIEEFPEFYPKLAPRMQTELINLLFGEFISMFN